MDYLTRVDIDDIIQDGNGNVYVVHDIRFKNTHSGSPSDYFVECVDGQHKGRTIWIGKVTMFGTKLKKLQ